VNLGHVSTRRKLTVRGREVDRIENEKKME